MADARVRARSALAFALCLFESVTAAEARVPAITVRGHLVSGSIGLTTNGGRTSLWQSTEADVRWIDLAVGPRFGERLSVMPWLVVADNISGYHYTAEPLSYITSVGLLVAWNITPRQSPRDVTLTAGLRGCNGWGVSWPGNRFIEASASIGRTFWFINPSIDVGWRRELKLDGVEPPGDFPRDRLWILVRAGLGGIYQLGRNRAQ